MRRQGAQQGRRIGLRAVPTCMVAVAVVAGVLTQSPVAANDELPLPLPVILNQPTSQTGVVGEQVSLMVEAEGSDYTFVWQKDGDDLLIGGDTTVTSGYDEETGTTSSVLTFNPLEQTDFSRGGVGEDRGYSVLVRRGDTTFESEFVSISPFQGGPLKVGAIPTPAGQINFSGFAAFPNPPEPAKPDAVTMLYDGQPEGARVFYLPGFEYLPRVVGTAFWFLFPQQEAGEQGPRCAGLAGQSEVNVTIPGAGGLDPDGFCLTSTPSDGASMTVAQDAPGSLTIRATMVSPIFEDILQPLVQDPFTVNFQVFDDATGDLIELECGDAGCPGRLGWRADVEGAGSKLRTVDTLVLPEGSIGKTIRVGALIYYYSDGYTNDGVLPQRYAALSRPMLMAAAPPAPSPGGGGTPVPEPTTAPTTPPVVPAPVESAAAVPQPAVAPEIANPGAVTAQQIAAFTPEQVSLIPPREFGQLPPRAIAALTPEQVEVLTPTQVNSIRPARAAAITPSAAAAMDPEQLEALRPASVRALPPATLAALSGEQLAALRPSAIARISPRALRALSPAQLRSLTAEQRSQLTRRQVRGLSPLQQAALRG